MQTIYGPQFSCPLARVVHGVPSSWDSSIATRKFPDSIQAAVWSPCSKFIAISWWYFTGIVILDAVTLEQLYTMYPQSKEISWGYIVFSPDNCVLTGSSVMGSCIISWDLQTGGQISSINTARSDHCKSIVYSESGSIIGVLFVKDTITIYDVPSGMERFSHKTQQSSIEAIWAYGEYLQFATIDSGSIITWQVSFTSSNPPIKVSSMQTPDGLSKTLVLQPTISRLAFTIEKRVLVWDTQNHKILLDSMSVPSHKSMSFSSDGHLFACQEGSQGFCIWKESLDGYLLHQKFISSSQWTTLVISPNAESIISFGSPILRLWHTSNSSTPSPNVPIQTSQETNLLLEFSSNESFMAYARWSNNTVTVLDTSSGSQLLVINTDMGVCGMKVTDGKIIIVSNEKVVTWDMPPRNCVLDIERNTSDSIQSIKLKGIELYKKLSASISPDLNYIALLDLQSSSEDICIYSMHTGEKLTGIQSGCWIIGFTPDPSQFWCGTEYGEVELWEIVVESGSNATKLERLSESTKLPGNLPWNSPCGYQVTDDGWILSSTGMHLMWLPYFWRTNKRSEKFWGKKLLALHNESLPKPLILRFEV